MWQAPNFLTLQVPRKLLNDAIHNLNTYAASRLATPSELLLTFDKIVAVINQGNFSGSLLLLVAHLKRVEVSGGSRWEAPERAIVDIRMNRDFESVYGIDVF